MLNQVLILFLLSVVSVAVFRRAHIPAAEIEIMSGL